MCRDAPCRRPRAIALLRPRSSQAASTKERAHSMKLTARLVRGYGRCTAANRAGLAVPARRSEEDVYFQGPEALVVAEVRADAIADSIEGAHLDELGEE